MNICQLILYGLFIFLIPKCILAEEKILNIYTWAGYVSESVVREFEKETGIRVNHSTYVNNEVLYAKLKANPHAGYDVVIPSSYFINRMVRQDLLQKIDKSRLKNLKHISPNFLNQAYDINNEYSVPYLWNSTGIAVNTRFHDVRNVSSWVDFWSPRYQDQILVLDDTREIFSVAFLALGYSVNETDQKPIKEAFQKLKLLMRNIKLFNLDSTRSIYLDEDITLGMAWSGDIYLAQQENSNLQFIYPKDGFLISIDCLAIPKGAKHVENAHRFIEFILRPEMAKQISLDTGFSTTNQTAKELLPEKMRRNEILYPSKNTLQRSQVLNDVGEAAVIYEKYFERLKLEQ